MKHRTNLEKLMDYLFGSNIIIARWDYTSLAYKYWKKYVRKQKTSLKNLKRRAKKILEEINKIVEEWVTEMRLSHILGKFESYSIENIKDIIKLMQEDVLREAAGEILVSDQNKELLKAIGKKTATMFKQRLQEAI